MYYPSKPEWVKLIPADSIPVFCFALDTTDYDLDRIGAELRAFFKDRKVLVLRGDVDVLRLRISAMNERCRELVPVEQWTGYPNGD